MKFNKFLLFVFLLISSCYLFAYDSENEIFRADGKHIAPGEDHNHTEKEHQAAENRDKLLHKRGDYLRRTKS